MQGIFQILIFCVFLLMVFLSIFGIIFLPFYYFFVFHGANKRSELTEAKLKSALMRDEQIIEHAFQHRVFGLFSRRKLIAISNSRIILINRGLLGGFVMQDIQWKDLTDARISENILPKYCGSRLEFLYSANNTKDNIKKGAIIINGIPVMVASHVYSKSQEEEQAWEEKRRIRDLEEKRATSGGINLQNGFGSSMPLQTSTESSPVNNNIYSEIEKIKQLLDMGAISDSEYNEIKAKILSKNF